MSRPYEIAADLMLYGRVTKSSMCDSMRLEKNIYAVALLRHNVIKTKLLKQDDLWT